MGYIRARPGFYPDPDCGHRFNYDSNAFTKIAVMNDTAAAVAAGCASIHSITLHIVRASPLPLPRFAAFHSLTPFT